MVFKLSTSNTKLVSTAKINKVKLLGFNLPAGSTCPFAGECKKFCYAQCGNFRFKNVQEALTRNLDATKLDSFVNDMVKQLTKSKVQVLRLHSSGDFYSVDYVNKWLEVSNSLPDVLFYAYTKSWRLFKGNKLPANFKLLRSAGSTVDSDLSKGNQVKTVPVNYSLGKNEVFGSDDDDLYNLNQSIAGKTVCLKAHGTKAKFVK